MGRGSTKGEFTTEAQSTRRISVLGILQMLPQEEVVTSRTWSSRRGLHAEEGPALPREQNADPRSARDDNFVTGRRQRAGGWNVVQRQLEELRVLRASVVNTPTEPIRSPAAFAPASYAIPGQRG